MRWHNSARGFTLIEITIVMAISALIVAGVFIGFGGQQQGEEFSSAMANITSQLQGVRNEGVNTVKDANGNGTDPQATVFGKLAVFGTNNNSYDVLTLVQQQPATPANCSWYSIAHPTDLYAPDCYTSIFPYGATLDGYSVAGSSMVNSGPVGVAFTDLPDAMYALPSSAFPPTACSESAGTFCNAASYTPASPYATNVIFLHFTSGDGNEHATIKVDPADNTVTRCPGDNTSC